MEQVSDNTPSYEELYDKGFEEQEVEVEAIEEDASIEDEPVEEEEEESVEQPTEEEPAEETDSELDEDTEEDATVEEASDSNDEPEKYSITIGGQEVTLTLEEMKLFAQKGGDYTRKTQDLAKSRADIEFMEEHGLSHEDLVTLKDIKAGNKDAFAAIAKQAGIDPLDVEDDSSYAPQVADRNFELEDTVNNIRNDAENGEVIDGWISVLPQSTKEMFAKNPAVLRGLHVDTVNGVSKDIMPEVIKQMSLNPNADFVQLYQTVGSQVVAPKKEEKPQAKRETKKRATVSKTKTTHLNDHKDIWDDDELYESMKKQLEALK